MEENKEETKLQSEQKMTLHELKGNINEVMNELRYGFTDYDEAADRLFQYASQFKSHSPIEQKQDFKQGSPEQWVSWITQRVDLSLYAKDLVLFALKESKSQSLPIEGVEREPDNQ